MSTPQNERRRIYERRTRATQLRTQEPTTIDSTIPDSLKIGVARQRPAAQQAQPRRVRAHTAAQLRARRAQPAAPSREDRVADIAQPAEIMSTYIEKKRPRKPAQRAKKMPTADRKDQGDWYDNEIVRQTRRRRATSEHQDIEHQDMDERQSARSRRAGKLPKLPEGLRTHIYMDLVQHQACRRIAHDAGTNISQVVRAALTYYLAQVLAPSGRGPRLKFLR